MSPVCWWPLQTPRHLVSLLSSWFCWAPHSPAGTWHNEENEVGQVRARGVWISALTWCHGCFLGKSCHFFHKASETLALVSLLSWTESGKQDSVSECVSLVASSAPHFCTFTTSHLGKECNHSKPPLLHPRNGDNGPYIWNYM